MQGPKKTTVSCLIDMTKAFDTASLSSLYTVLEGIDCPPVLLQLVISFHEDRNAVIQFDGNTSDSVKVVLDVKQGCVLGPTLFAINVAALLHHTFGSNENGVYLRTRFDGPFFSI